MTLTVTPTTARNWTDEQVGIVMAGIEATNGSLGRVYARNRMIRRLLQRAGFVLLSVTKQQNRTVHVYGLRRQDFYNLTQDAGWL